MKHTKKSNGKISAKAKPSIRCKHCKKQIDHAKLIGFSLICPLCAKPQNGHSLI